VISKATGESNRENIFAFSFSPKATHTVKAHQKCATKTAKTKCDGAAFFRDDSEKIPGIVFLCEKG
jgi:hypothetical protein